MNTGSFQEPFHEGMTLGEAREVLRPLAVDGAPCPCCTQHVEVQVRSLTEVHARTLLALYTDHGLAWAHLPTVIRDHLPSKASQAGYLTLSQHWGLMESEVALRRPVDGGGRPGWWRVTREGERWLYGHTGVPRYADVFNARCLNVHGPLVFIRDALGEQFDLPTLLGRRATAEAAGQLFDLPQAA